MQSAALLVVASALQAAVAHSGRQTSVSLAAMWWRHVTNMIKPKTTTMQTIICKIYRIAGENITHRAARKVENISSVDKYSMHHLISESATMISARDASTSENGVEIDLLVI